MKILVADDELVSRAKLQKILEPYGSVEGFEDGSTATKAFQKACEEGAPYDILMLDLIMPEMGGTEALKAIREIERELTSLRRRSRAFIVTSKSDRSSIIAAVRAGCDGFVVKPFDPEVIEKKLEGFGIEVQSASSDEKTWQDQMRRDVQDIIEKFKKGHIELPVMPEVVHQTQEIINKPGSNVNDLSQVVEKDVVVSAKLIAIANSPKYLGMDKVDNVRQAVARLGFKETQALILALANRGFYRSKNRQLRTMMDKLRLHSLACAYGASQLAAKSGFKETEKYFLLGLIHNIGSVLLIWLLAEIALQNEALKMEDVVLEVQKLHSAFGAVLLERWKFPEDMITVVKMHEGPNFPPDTPPEVLIINLANSLAFKIGYGFYTREEQELSELDSARLLNFSAEDLEAIGTTVLDSVKQAFELV